MHVGPFGRVAAALSAALCCGVGAHAAPALPAAPVLTATPSRSAASPSPGAAAPAQFAVQCARAQGVSMAPGPLPDSAILASPAPAAEAGGDCVWLTAGGELAGPRAAGADEPASSVAEVDTYFMFLTGLGAVALVAARSQRSSPWSATRVGPR